MQLTIPNLWKANTITDINIVKATYPMVILRVGYGSEKDEKFEENYKKLTDAGVPVGVFYFPLDQYTSKYMVDLCIKWMTGKTIQLLAPDVEHPAPGYGNTLSKTTVDGFIAEFEKRVEKPAIYSSLARWLEIMQNTAQYAGYVNWVSNPGSASPAMPAGWTTWGLWQFLFNQDVPGITGGVDLNYFHSEELAKLKPFTIGEPPPTPETSNVLWVGRVNGSLGLNVRATPATNGKYLRTLSYLTDANVYEVQGTWARINSAKQEWCYIAPDCLVKKVVVPILPPVVLPPASGGAIDVSTFPCFSQRDPRWASDKLGTSDSTMGGWGCVVTANATIYKYYGIDTDPGRLNKSMIGWDGYDNTNLWRWWTPSLYLPIAWAREPAGTTSRTRIDLVRELTSQGIPPILCVDFNLAQTDLQSHFVVGLGVTNDNDVLIMDSWDGKIKSFKSAYGSPLWGIWRVDIYRKTG